MDDEMSSEDDSSLARRVLFYRLTRPAGWYKTITITREMIMSVLDDDLKAAEEWISVKERMPKTIGDYWVFRRPQYGFYSMHPMSVREWDGFRWLSRQEVTHWMPLPDAPKEPEGES